MQIGNYEIRKKDIYNSIRDVEQGKNKFKVGKWQAFGIVIACVVLANVVFAFMLGITWFVMWKISFPIWAQYMWRVMMVGALIIGVWMAIDEVIEYQEYQKHVEKKI